MFEQGVFSFPVERVLSSDRAGAARQASVDGHVPGRYVVRPRSEPPWG